MSNSRYSKEALKKSESSDCAASEDPVRSECEAHTSRSRAEHSSRTGSSEGVQDGSRRFFQGLPKAPGVYLMKDKKGVVLYVGKAKNLKVRIKQYFSGTDTRPQIPALMKRVNTVDTIVVTSEKEALILENTLIKKHQPHYNVFLKDDKGYISLKLTKHKWPMVQLVRHKKKENDALYFGPYTSTYAAKQTLDLLIRLFPLRRCSDRELLNRTRPCILYQIKRCVAPCVGKCTKEEYDAICKQMIKFLQGKSDEVLKDLYKQMESASEALNFERAEDLLKTIRHLETTVEQQRVDQAGAANYDVIGFYREGGDVSISQLLFREGKLVGAENYHFSSVLQEDEALLSSFLIQLYEEPKAALVPIKLPHLDVHAPQRGDKKALVEMANANAKASFQQSSSRENALLEMEEKLRLNNYPRRIECFDNSHMGGAEPVSAMVVFTDGEPDKQRYRKFKMKQAQDDYAAMREVLLRRYAKGDLPDLIIIDGGKGHLNVALKVLDELNVVTVDVIGVAKESAKHTKGLTLEQIFRPGIKDPLILRKNSPILFLLQRIRDEAHRFAITFHRKRRSKAMLKSPLDNIPGIGPAKKKSLLQHFGSAKKALSASREELEKVPGLSQKNIETILEVTS